MKHDYTNETIQAAIDAACASDNVAEELHTSPKSRWWECQAEFRLNLARGLLARLPSPDASQDSQPAEAEIPWTEWHGGPCPLNDDEVEEWEWKCRDGSIWSRERPSTRRWRFNQSSSDIIAYRVLKKKKPEPQDPYAELKKAHAEGKVIQVNVGKWVNPEAKDLWEDRAEPAWDIEVDFYRIKPTSETFEAHGKTWTRHTPGDPMPCGRLRKVNILCEDVEMWSPSRELPACGVNWELLTVNKGYNVIGWRYADEPPKSEKVCQFCGSELLFSGDRGAHCDGCDDYDEWLSYQASPAPAWKPAVGDVVRLKSDGPKMTVIQLKGNECQAIWYDHEGMQSFDFFIACLTPAKEDEP